MKIYYRRLLYTFYTPQQYTLQDKKTRNKRKKMQQNSQLLATETGPYDEGGKNASRRFSLIYRSHLHAAGKRYQTLSTTISTGITIYSRPAIVCVHSTVTATGTVHFSSLVTIFITLRATMNYTVVQGNSLVQWCIFVFFFEKGEKRIINYRQRFHN